MSLRIIQSYGKAAFAPVDVPWAAFNGAEVSMDLSVSVFVTVELLYSSFFVFTTLEVAPVRTVRQGMSFNMGAIRELVNRKLKRIWKGIVAYQIHERDLLRCVRNISRL